MNRYTRPHGPETRKRIERLRLKAWTPADAPRAPEAPPIATALQTIANALARLHGTAPQRPAVGISLAAAAVLVGRAHRPAGQATGAVAPQKGGRP